MSDAIDRSLLERRARNRERQRKMIQRRRDNGLCLDCETPALQGKRYCQRHLEWRKSLQQKYREKRKETGQ